MITKKQSAFSLMEIMIAVTIIGILASLVGPQIIKAMRRVKITQTTSVMRTIQGAINEFYGDVKKYPTKLDDLIDRPSGPPAAGNHAPRPWTSRPMTRPYSASSLHRSAYQPAAPSAALTERDHCPSGPVP